ncbi:MAG: AMP-binding protein [Adlercreutzia equolifaciens]
MPQRGDAHPREPCRRRAHPRDERELVAPAGEIVGEALSALRASARPSSRARAGATSTARCAPPRPTSPAARRRAPIPCSCISPGTSGNPKMVLHDSGYALAHLITAKHWHNVNPRAALHHRRHRLGQGGLGQVLRPVAHGGRSAHLRLRPLRSGRDSLLVGRYGVTTLCCPPTMYRLMTEVDVDAFDLSSLEYCTTAGEALNPDLFDFWREHTGLTIYEGFGQTETPLTVGNLTNSTPRPGSMGKPVPMYVMKVLREDGTECDTGETGEICIAIDPHPAGIMMEYYRNPEKTAEAMHDGWYHTGDTAWRDEEATTGTWAATTTSSSRAATASAPSRSSRSCSSTTPCARAVTGVPDPCVASP